ncbi:MAG: hypothetical protein ACLFTG_12285 [Alphaproteobacteria bacterium]
MSCLGAPLLALASRRLSLDMRQEVISSAGVSNALVFWSSSAPPLFADLLRALEGDDPHRNRPADVVSDAALRLLAGLHEGRGPRGGAHAARLPWHHPLCAAGLAAVGPVMAFPSIALWLPPATGLLA